MASSDKTPLYQEALIEVKKLRDLAKKDAEKSILEKFSPIVDQIIDKEMSRTPILFEADEDPAADPNAPVADAAPAAAAPAGAPAPGAAAAAPQVPATAPMDANVTPPGSDESAAMPAPATDASAAPMPDMGADAANPAMPMPGNVDAAPVASGELKGISPAGPDGKIVVDLESLFSSKPETAGTVSTPEMAAAPTATPAATETMPAATMPGGAAVAPEAATPAPAASAEGAEAPAATPTEEEAQPAAAAPAASPAQLTEMINNSVQLLNQEINGSVSNKKFLSEIKKNILKNKIFALYEVIQKTKATKQISEASIAYAEVRMELMFAKLKESANQDNSYNRQTNKKDVNNMAKKDFRTLKEFAEALFSEEASDGFSEKAPKYETEHNMDSESIHCMFAF